MSDQTPTDSTWRNSEFGAYLASTGFSGLSFAMQQLLVSWLLVGVLLLPADRVGIVQALIGIPGIFLMLWGGASADRRDVRTMLIKVFALAPICPLFLLLVDGAGWLDVFTVTLWGLAMSVVTSFTMPAQQALLNQVSGSAVQQGVTAATAIGFLVQIIGLSIAGQLELLGLTTILVVQAAGLVIAALLMLRIKPHPIANSQVNESAWSGIVQGFKATKRNPIVFEVLVFNFTSTIFNAGAFMTVFPFIIKRVYDGDAALLATMMIVFFAGAMVANLIMLKFMPIRAPGKWFLLMQLTRIVVLWLLWIEPSWWLSVVAIVGWGLNMGVTSNLARTIVQESAEAEFRGRIMSVFTLGLIGSAPIGAIILGWMIERFGTLNALIPAMVLSVGLFVYGVLFTGIWGYRSGR